MIKECIDNYKSFETLKLKRYIAQKSSGAPPTEVTKECIDSYKDFETLNLKRYIAEKSSATSLTESIKTSDLTKTTKENKEIPVGNFQILAAPQRLLPPISLRQSFSNKTTRTSNAKVVLKASPPKKHAITWPFFFQSGSDISAPRPHRRTPLPSQAEAFIRHRVQQASALNRPCLQHPTSPRMQTLVLFISQKTQGPQQSPFAPQRHLQVTQWRQHF